MATDFNAGLGRQQFLQLMVAQIQYQNPLQPVEQQDFLSQLAQFSVLDGVESLNVRFDDMLKLQSLSQGAGMAGRTIEYQSPISGEILTGRVTAARAVNNQLMLSVNDELVSLNDVISVLADAPAA